MLCSETFELAIQTDHVTIRFHNSSFKWWPKVK